MKERPILFSAPMVRALLAGTKTQTRRVVRQQPPGSTTDVMTWHHPDDERKGAHFWSFGPDPANPGRDYIQPYWAVPCPYGQPGDRLWVRETWRIGAWNEDDQQIAVDYADGPDKNWRQVPLTPEGLELFDQLWIQSSNECRRKGVRPNVDGNYRWQPGESPLRWRPNIHMPRWASRITLEITGVRVERLQDISEAAAIAEGIARHADGNGFHTEDGRHYSADPRESFASLWESINGHGSWDANPWVFVIEFKRINP